MTANIIGGVICAIIGIIVAYVNYIVSKYVLTKHTDKFMSVTVLRQVVQVAYLVAVYLVGGKTPCEPMYLLIGAVLGMTVPMFIFTKKLLAVNETFNKKERGKEEDKNG